MDSLSYHILFNPSSPCLSVCFIYRVLFLQKAVTGKEKTQHSYTEKEKKNQQNNQKTNPKKNQNKTPLNTESQTFS